MGPKGIINSPKVEQKSTKINMSAQEGPERPSGGSWGCIWSYLLCILGVFLIDLGCFGSKNHLKSICRLKRGPGDPLEGLGDNC